MPKRFCLLVLEEGYEKFENKPKMIHDYIEALLSDFIFLNRSAFHGKLLVIFTLTARVDVLNIKNQNK